MRFIIRRYLYGILARRVWLLAILIPPLVYLGLSAIRADQFFVMQDVAISADSPVALTSNPVDFQTMNEILSRPESLFQDSLALRDIYADLYGGTTAELADKRYRMIAMAAGSDLSVRMLGDKAARVSYQGKDQKLGQKMVGHYSQRLVQRAQQGFIRSKQRARRDKYSKGLAPSMGEPRTIGTVGFKGELIVEEQRALWRSERAAPLAWTLATSLFIVLVLLGVLEWSDPAFKSERQVARYLGLPILGSLPDLTLISDALGGKRGS